MNATDLKMLFPEVSVCSLGNACKNCWTRDFNIHNPRKYNCKLSHPRDATADILALHYVRCLYEKICWLRDNADSVVVQQSSCDTI